MNLVKKAQRYRQELDAIADRIYADVKEEATAILLDEELGEWVSSFCNAMGAATFYAAQDIYHHDDPDLIAIYKQDPIDYADLPDRCKALLDFIYSLNDQKITGMPLRLEYVSPGNVTFQDHW